MQFVNKVFKTRNFMDFLWIPTQKNNISGTLHHCVNLFQTATQIIRKGNDTTYIKLAPHLDILVSSIVSSKGDCTHNRALWDEKERSLG